MEKINSLLYVEVNHTTLEPFIRLQGEKKTLPLTTLADNQKEIRIRIYMSTQSEPVLLKIISVKNLPPKKAGKLRIDLQGEFVSETKLKIQLYIEKKPEFQTVIDIPVSKTDPKRSFLWFLLLIPIVFIIGAVIFMEQLPWNSDPGVSSPRGESAKESSSTNNSSNLNVSSESSMSLAASASSVSTESSASTVSSESSTSTVSSESSTSTVSTETSASSTSGEAAELIPVAEKTVVYFEPETDILTPETRQILLKWYESFAAARSAPDDTTVFSIIIHGHCADFGTKESQERLSQSRAQKTFQYLAELGLPENNVNMIQGFGSTRPITKDEDFIHLNRRVEILVEKH